MFYKFELKIFFKSEDDFERSSKKNGTFWLIVCPEHHYEQGSPDVDGAGRHRATLPQTAGGGQEVRHEGDEGQDPGAVSRSQDCHS